MAMLLENKGSQGQDGAAHVALRSPEVGFGSSVGPAGLLLLSAFQVPLRPDTRRLLVHGDDDASAFREASGGAGVVRAASAFFAATQLRKYQVHVPAASIHRRSPGRCPVPVGQVGSAPLFVYCRCRADGVKCKFRDANVIART
jgi:hypothetical protein